MATASLGRLTLDLVTKIGNFTGPMTQAERQARDSSKNIANSFSVASVAATAFGTAVAGISIGSMIAFADQTIQAGSEIKKLAQLANTSVRDFQYYAKGAETAGVSMESFADKMKDMQDRIGDFQQTGGGPLADFFENIAPLVGVTIQQFQKLSGPQALQLYYDSLQKVGASQNDMKFYMEAIISDSSLLIPLLENGGEGFRKWGEAAERANAIMSDQMIENLALAKENVQMLSLQWDGLKATLVNNVVPVVQTVSDNMDNVKAVALGLTAAMAVKLVPTVIASSIQLAQLAAFSVRASVGLAGLSASATATSSAMVALRGVMAFLGGPAGLAMLAAQGVAAGAAFYYMKKASDEVKPALDSQSLSVQDLVSNYEKLNESAKRNQLRVEGEKLSELGDEYENASSKLISLVVAMGRFDGSTSEAVRQANALAMQYKQGDISAEQLASKINALAGASNEAKQKIDSQVSAVNSAASEMRQQQKVVESLTAKNNELANSHSNAAQKANSQANSLSSLTQKQREALKGINEEIQKSQYIEANVAAGWSREKAEAAAKYRQDAEIGFQRKLTEQEIKTIELGYKVQAQNKAREESEKKLQDAKQKQIELDKKQYSYRASELEMLKKVAAISSKYNLNEIGSKYGVPENMLAAVMAQESKGNMNARSQTGAIGAFQTTSIFRKQWGLTVEDSLKDIPKTAEAVSKALQQGYKEFGNWEDAITSINAGIAGTKNLNAKGFTGSAAKTKEASQYASLVDKWFVGLSGSNSKTSGFVNNDVAESIADYQKYLENIEQVKKEFDERRKQITQKYYSEEERLAAENTEAIKEINEAYIDDETAREKYLKLQQLAYQKDVEEFKKAQQQKRDAAFSSTNNPIGDMVGMGVNARAKASLNSNQYAQWGLNSEQQDGYSQLGDDLYSARSGIESNEYLSETEKYQQLNDAYKVYLDGKKALTEEYAKQEADYAQYQHDNQLSMYGSLLSQAGTVWGSMTEMVKDAAGEGSAAYKAMFLAQQAIAIGQAIINTELGATAALKVDPTGFMSMMTRGIGYASVGLIAAQTIQGMAHDGIDNIPKEGTWLLDKGERVVDSRTNADLKNYLANGGGSGGDVKISQSITFADGGAKVDTEGQKEIAQSLNNMMDAWARRESRQGGVLHKLARG